jgi:hypothetical protein
MRGHATERGCEASLCAISMYARTDARYGLLHQVNANNIDLDDVSRYLLSIRTAQRKSLPNNSALGSISFIRRISTILKQGSKSHASREWTRSSPIGEQAVPPRIASALQQLVENLEKIVRIADRCIGAASSRSIAFHVLIRGPSYSSRRRSRLERQAPLLLY